MNAKARKREGDRNQSFNSLSGNKVLSYQLLIVSIDPGVNSNHIISIEGERINSTFLTGCISSISKSLTGVPLPRPGDCLIYRIYLISYSTLAKMQTFRDFNKIKKGINSCPGSFVTMRGRTEVS